MRQTLRPNAAPTRTVLGVLIASLLSLSLSSLPSRADDSASSRREAAKAQFDRAEKARQALESRAENSRTLKEYNAVVSEYQRVSLITPRAADVPASLNEVADLYRAMGDLFDAKFYPKAIEAYQFLLKQYPDNKYREDALLAIADIQAEDLHDTAAAQKNYELFLSQHPRSQHAADVRATLNKMKAEALAAKNTPLPLPPPAPAANANVERPLPKPISADKSAPSTDTRPGAPDDAAGSDGSGPQVSRIRTWNADTYTRIVIDVGTKVKYQAARITGPDRIYFDIEGSRLSAALLRKPIDVDGGYLKNIRVAQYQSGIVRVVLEVNHVSDYSVFLLPDPYRLVVDVYGNPATAEAAARNLDPQPGPTTMDVPQNKVPQTNAEKPSDKQNKDSGSKPPKSANVAAASGGVSPSSDDATDDAGVPAKPASGKNPPKAGVVGSGATKPQKGTAKDDSTLTASAAPADVAPLPLPTQPVAPKKAARSSKSAHDQAEEMGPAATPELTRDGQRSLTRALGLKISRIVIDAGHGGHDTGTIGPTGLMEKDLCLDVALRLGKIIQQKLPGADVVYTRDDDTFIPLERRTEMANEAKADLFISIHANSSQDRQARGIETYYLNFTGSSDAMEVAARENAFSENGVHDLQDIVAKIARNEKIEESRDFASIVQDSLAKRMETVNRGDRNRGVRKAPFVVLIGADMPSVLAEISFLSNPSDEQWLKKPENRQRVADGLYHGVEGYLQSTNSLTSNQTRSAAENLAGKVARSGNSQ